MVQHSGACGLNEAKRAGNEGTKGEGWAGMNVHMDCDDDTGVVTNRLHDY